MGDHGDVVEWLELVCVASNTVLLELLSHSSCVYAIFSNLVRPWRLGASLESRRHHPSYCVGCTFRFIVL